MNRLGFLRIPVALALAAVALLLAACTDGQSADSGTAGRGTSTTVTATVESGGSVPHVTSVPSTTLPHVKKPPPKTTTPPPAKGGSGPGPTPTTLPPGPSRQLGPCVAGFVCGHVTAIGDSVMLDAQPDLQFDIRDIDVDAEVSRQWDSGVQLAQEMRADGTLGSIVVVDLGTNGPVDLQQFQQMMSALSGVSRAVFVTVHLPPSYSWANSVNATLEQGVSMYRNATLVNFNALADANPEWFGPDGVHMPIGGTGAQAMARLIASAC
jgi:hypothetical protein